MAEIRRKLVLTGARTGKTCVLNKYQFVNGITYVEGPDKDVDGISKYFAVAYKAFPEGSAELAYMQRVDHDNSKLQEVLHGISHAAPDSQPGRSGEVSSNIQPGRVGLAQKGPNAGAGAATPPPGSTGSVPGGPGHADAGLDELKRAVVQLNPSNDEHWTSEGKPAIAALAQICRRANITRAEVEAAAPGVTRSQNG